MFNFQLEQRALCSHKFLGRPTNDLFNFSFHIYTYILSPHVLDTEGARMNWEKMGLKEFFKVEFFTDFSITIL